MLPYKVGGGRSVVTHTATAGSVITQSIAFKYVMASEPWKTWYLKQVMADLPYNKIYLFKNTYSIERKMV